MSFVEEEQTLIRETSKPMDVLQPDECTMSTADAPSEADWYEEPRDVSIVDYGFELFHRLLRWVSLLAQWFLSLVGDELGLAGSTRLYDSYEPYSEDDLDLERGRHQFSEGQPPLPSPQIQEFSVSNQNTFMAEAVAVCSNSDSEADDYVA